MPAKDLSQSKKQTSFYSNACKLLVGLFFVVLVILPLLRLFLNIDADSIQRVFSGPNFLLSAVQSLTVASLSTLITIVLAYYLAICVERTDIRLKSFWSILLVLPMLIPSISHGMGLIVLLGNNGIITRLLHLQWNIYGMWGIIIGSVMYAFPVAFLMIKDILKYENGSSYEAADILGIPKWRQFTAISLPYLRKPLISVTFAIFAMVITDYGVPLVVGGKYTTIPVVMFQEVIGRLDFGKGSVYGVLLLIPAVIAFIFDLLNKDKGNSSFVIKKVALAKGKYQKAAAYAYCTLISLCVFLPICAFLILGFSENYPINLTFTFDSILKTFHLNASSYLLNSVVIALLVSLLGAAIAFITAYLTARMQTRSSKLLHLASITSAAIPGIVLGLSYVIVFKGSILYGTIAVLIMVNTIHFFASPYLMMYNSLNKINENLEAVGETLGISRIRMIKDVFIPQSMLTIYEMISYFFVNCMMTISAVSFLATTANKPIALTISQFEAQAQLECAAVVSLLILMTNIIFKVTIYGIKRLSAKGKEPDDKLLQEGTL